MKQKLKLSLVIFLSVFSLNVVGQDAYELNEINKSAKTLYVTPGTLDRLMTRLRVIEKSIPKDQEALLLETYKIITSQYVANNHFSQAYQVFSRYITVKEEITARNYALAIDSTKNDINERRLTDGTEVMNLQNQVQQLQIDNDLLISKRLNFKKYFSFIIIALSTVFALMLVKTAISLFTIRSQIKDNKDLMKQIHRQATLGAFTLGLVAKSRQKAGETEDLVNSISSNFQTLGYKDAGNNASEIHSQCKDLIKNLNSSGIDA
ncbi:MAG: hypothetical protein KA444_01635 [Bacteroidia bacterium]|nr:hypothetical protein [Bacteroidia bacterium]